MPAPSAACRFATAPLARSPAATATAAPPQRHEAGRALSRALFEMVMHIMPYIYTISNAAVARCCLVLFFAADSSVSVTVSQSLSVTVTQTDSDLGRNFLRWHRRLVLILPRYRFVLRLR